MTGPPRGPSRRCPSGWPASTGCKAAIMAVLFLVFGFKLVGDGIAVLL